MFYKLSQELFDKSSTVLISTFLFTVTPSILTRTSVFIPESMGIFLFISICYFIVKYVKTIPNYDELSKFKFDDYFNIFHGNLKYLIYGLLILCIYIFTHRSWIFLALIVIILLIIFLLPSFKEKPLLISLILGLVLVIIYIFVTLVGRFQQEAVTLLGFPKWIGIITLILGTYGLLYFLKSQNTIHKLISLWAIVFMLIGTYSFRFRDPYSAIPLIIISAYILSEKIIPYIKKSSLLDKYEILGINFGKYWKYSIIIFLLLIPLVQGSLINYTSINQPTESQILIFDWLKNNTEEDTIIMSNKDDAYLLIGNTHRKDVVLWKTVYQGFLGNAPSKKETKEVQEDISLLFATEQNNEIYYLLEKYNASYIYISQELYNTESNGIITQAAIDTHYTTAIATKDSTIYKYNKNPPISTQSSLEYQSPNAEYNKTISFIEKFWNGYAYSDIGKKKYNDEATLFEFETTYKGDYSLNAQIAALYKSISNGNDSLNQRADYLISWLNYKQMPNGSFLYSFPPEEYSLETMNTIYNLKDINSTNSLEIKDKGLNFIKQVSGKNYVKINSNSKESFENGYVAMKTYSQICGMNSDDNKNLMSKLIDLQKRDGSFTNEAYQNVEILKGMCLYYNKTHDDIILTHIKKGAEWLNSNQNVDGKFISDGSVEDYGINHYADTALIYYTINDTNNLNKTLKYIEKQNIEQDINPLKSYLTLINNLNMIYDDENIAFVNSNILI